VSARRGVLLALAAAGCNPNMLWPASMDQQPAIRPLAEARPAVAGAVPIGGVEVVFDRDDLVDTPPPAAFDAVSAKFPPAPNLRHIAICKRTNGFLYGTLTVGGKAMPPMREGTTSRERWDLVAFVREVQREGCTGTMGQPEGTP
jgi:hypothetical protein